MTQKQVTDKLRNDFLRDLSEFLASKYDTDICQTAAGTVMIPVVDSEGEDRWVKFSVIIPKEATEENGNDGYSLAQEYAGKQKAAADRKAKREAESEKKKKIPS